MGRNYVIGSDPQTKQPIVAYGEHVSRIVSANGTWVASAQLADIQLDKDLLITNITLQAAITATLTATAVADAPKRVLNNLTIVGDGKNFLSLSGGTTQLGVLLALLNQFDSQGAGLDSNTDVGDTAFNQFFNFHPGHNIKDKFDISAVIPARALSNLVARIGCPAAAITDPAGVITAGTYTLEIDGVQGIPLSPNMMVPGPYITAFPHNAITGLYGQPFDIPTGAYVRRVAMLFVDNTATTPLRSDAQVTSCQVRIVKDSKPIIQKSILGLKYASSLRYGVVGDQQPLVLGAIATTRPGYNGAMHMPLGFAVIDFRDYFDPVRGLNMRYPGVQQGDAKLDLTIGVATGTTYLYWDLWYPPDPMWIGK